MRVSVAQLRAVSERLLLHLEQTGYEQVELKVDHYWHIPQEGRYNLDEEPKGLTIGQLSDDWQELEKILAGRSEPLGYGLVWLAAILEAVGEEVVA